MSRSRLFLADGVGLGKTIQAGLILTEFIARRIAHRILVVSPAGPLLEQWKTEMSERFGLRLDVIDRPRLEEIKKQTELGANPFDHLPLGLVSIDFLKQERILDQLERSSYDVVVIDEAHHCMDLGAMGEREDSQRRKLAQVLSRRCDALLLLTATPHDGNDRSFASLCELLDPSLVDGRGSLRGDRYRAYVVRRLKQHIIDPKTGEELFKKRIVYPVPVIPDLQNFSKFIELHHALLDLVAPELRRAFRARRYNDVLSFIALLKRSVSTVDACRSTLQVVADRFQRILHEGVEIQESHRQRLRTLREYQRNLERFGTVTPEEEGEHEFLEAEDLAQRLANLQQEVRSGSRKIKRTADVAAALEDLLSLAEEARSHDPKLVQLAAEVRAIRQKEPGANILIYTEYITSQQAAAIALGTAGISEIKTMSGEDDEATRKKITDLFRSRDGLVLVSTDTAAEGLNLHERCHHLIHLELPFNPNRLEQRNGRIDRYGQERNPVVRYLYIHGTFEGRILLRLIAKYEKQRERLTFVPNTLGLTISSETMNQKLLGSILEEDTKLFRAEEPIFNYLTGDEDTSDQATQELLEEIDRSLKGYAKATRLHAWLGEAGLNAEDRLLQEANHARHRGDQVSAVDLARFVTDAVLLDGGVIKGSLDDETFTVVLPPAWIHGLSDMPGYDPQSRTVRLTTRLPVMRDAQDRPVGFLGRAHPLVQRALSRVRHLSFGTGQHSLDIRVSAVAAAVPQPTLLFTFLGRILSRAGRELERVIGVRLPAGEKPEFLGEPHVWLSIADTARAIRTSGFWEAHFAPWAGSASEIAHSSAAAGFGPLAAAFIKDRRRALQAEKEDLQKWLAQRSQEITGETHPAPRQRELFQQSDAEESQEAWQQSHDPAERLAAFAADSGQPLGRRSEAEGVLRLYRQRLQDLEDRFALGDPEILPLGLLMIIPESAAN
ncbi:MAG: helicase-related protein [Thermodesulfobacteriota bacterium]